MPIRLIYFLSYKTVFSPPFNQHSMYGIRYCTNRVTQFDNIYGLTIMVNKVLSRYNNSPPTSRLGLGTPRLIEGGPLYPDILEILDSCTVCPLTSKCTSDLALYGVELHEVRQWLKKAVESNGYINSQWCSGSAPNTVVACDAYKVLGIIDMKSFGNKELSEIYIKFCISKTGSTVLTISFHPSAEG